MPKKLGALVCWDTKGECPKRERVEEEFEAAGIPFKPECRKGNKIPLQRILKTYIDFYHLVPNGRGNGKAMYNAVGKYQMGKYSGSDIKERILLNEKTKEVSLTYSSELNKVVTEQLRTEVGYLDGRQFGHLLGNALENHADAIPIRRKSGVHFIPADHLKKGIGILKAARDSLEPRNKMELYIFGTYYNTEACLSIQAAARSHFETLINTLYKQVKDHNVKDTQSRLDDLGRIKEKIQRYSDRLGIQGKASGLVNANYYEELLLTRLDK
jgi:hypothetical protein